MLMTMTTSKGRHPRADEVRARLRDLDGRRDNDTVNETAITVR
jgi:hypothetical protein